MKIPKAKQPNKLPGLEGQYHSSACLQDYVCNYFRYLWSMLERLDTAVIERMIETLAKARQRGSTIYLIGNGGSAAAASHFANDLTVGTWPANDPPFRVVCLTDNVPIMTAIANDTSYANIFVNQLQNLLQPGDILFALSVSGNSPNILEAVRFARINGGETIGCCGLEDSALRELVDICLCVPSQPGEYGPVEDVMTILGHVIYSYFLFSSCGKLRDYPPFEDPTERKKLAQATKPRRLSVMRFGHYLKLLKAVFLSIF